MSLTRNPRELYARARKEWDDRFGDLYTEKRRWHTIAIALLALNALSLSANVWQMQRTHIVPFIVKENSLGNLEAWGTPEVMTEANYRQTVAELVQWIQAARSVSADRTVQKDRVEHAFSFLTQRTKAQLIKYYDETNPFEVSKKNTVTVDVKSASKVTGNTWQLRWIEARHTPHGRLIDKVNWEATLDLKYDQPTDVSTLLRNPGGIFITSLSWSAELGQAL
jgi:type IV secretion system protein VirB5